MNTGKVTALTLLNLSAAFDTIDHTILLRRLADSFGVTGKTLDWFKSYMTGRCQRVKLGDCLSSKPDLKVGVPQGWVLGPLLFTLYTTQTCISYAYSVYSQLIALRGMFPDTFQVCPSLPFLEKPHTQ